jgi:tRNA(adenine34) deaminase
LQRHPDDYMEVALRLARQASAANEVPVGAVIVTPEGEPRFTGRNESQAASPLHHAEMQVLNAALAERGRHGMGGCTLYVTLEPCIMCLGAMVQARIGGLVYGCSEPRFGGVEVLQALWKEGRYPHRFPIVAGLKEQESRDLLQDFFQQRRREMEP